MSANKRVSIRFKDVVIILMLLVAFPVTAILSRRWLVNLSGALSPLFRLSHGGKVDANIIETALGVDQNVASDIATNSLQARLLSMLLFIKSVIYGPQRPVALNEKERLENALADGKGAVLWVAELTYGPDACKVALADNDFAVSHLSRPEHGFSSSAFGIKYLNPIRTNYELRFLKERIVFTPEQREAVAEQITQTLAQNEIVSFLASGHVGRSLIKAPFLNGTLSMAGGAAAAAYKNGAPLFPVFCRPDGAHGTMTVTIGEQIDLVGETKQQIIHDATVEYIRRLESEVKLHPELFLQWKFVSLEDETH